MTKFSTAAPKPTSSGSPLLSGALRQARPQPQPRRRGVQARPRQAPQQGLEPLQRGQHRLDRHLAGRGAIKGSLIDDEARNLVLAKDALLAVAAVTGLASVVNGLRLARPRRARPQ